MSYTKNPAYRYATEPAGGGPNTIPCREIQNIAYAAAIAIVAIDSRSEEILIDFAKLTGNTTLTIDTTNPYKLDRLILNFAADTTNRTVTFSTGFAGLASITVNASTTAQALFIFDGTNWSAIGSTITGTITTSGLSVGTGGVTNTTNLGTTPVGTVSIKEYSNGREVVAVLTLTNFIVGANASAAAALGIGNIFYAMPAGQELELVYGLDGIVVTSAGTAVTGVLGIGSVIASGAVSVLSGTATFQDRFAGVAATTGASGGAAVSGLKAATAGIGTGIALNVAASVKNFFLNFAGTMNANNTGNLTASGTIVVKYTIM